MSKIIQIAPTFWNIRASLTFLGGLIDIGTHMSMIRLSNGKFLLIDTCDVSQSDKARIDELTENGTKIEAIVATHPFHTLYFRLFHKWYPNTKYYGTPRHLRNFPDIPWAGDISKNLNLWENEGIFMRIPDGSDFDPADQNNHFSSVLVFHQASRSLHADDTIMYYDHPGCALRCLGARHGNTTFWTGVDKGLKKTKEAPVQFRSFMESVLKDWDFDNLITAHTGNLIGGGKEAVREALRRATPTLEKMAK